MKTGWPDATTRSPHPSSCRSLCPQRRPRSMLRWPSFVCFNMAVSSYPCLRLARPPASALSDSWCGPLRTPTAQWTASFMIRAAAAPQTLYIASAAPLLPVTVTALVSWLH